MIIPMNAPLTIRQNDNPFRVTFTAVDALGAPIDFSSGYSARLQMRLYPGAGGTALVNALSTATSGTRLVMRAEGIDLVVVKGDIPDLIGAPGRDQVIKYDLLIKFDGGDENAWFEGDVTLKLGVTD